MEILLLLAILIGVFFAFGGSGKYSNGAQLQKTMPARKSKDQLAPFDAQSTQSQNNPLVLKGSAYIIDGDSLVIQKTQIRLFGIDAPELNHPYGKNAKWALIDLCKGQIIRAQVVAVDAHHRTVARCYLQDGRDLSAEMIKLGMAIDWPKFSGGEYRALEVFDARKKLWLADARQKGRMHVWEQFEAKQNARQPKQ